MFGSIFRRVEERVDSKIDQALGKLGMVALFLIAAGFGTAALADYLTEIYDARTANMILAGAFAFFGLLAGLASWMRSAAAQSPAAATEEADAGANTASAEAAGPLPNMSDVDRELLLGVLSTAAPLALPKILSLVGRNLPLIVALAASVFFAVRSSSADNSVQDAPVAAE